MIRYAKQFGPFTESVRRILTGGDEANWQFAKRIHGAENGFKSLDLPIVADQQEHEITFLNLAAQPRFGAQREPPGRRKLRGVNTVGDDADVLAPKVFLKKAGSALRDGGQGNFWIRIDAAFERGQESIV